MINREKIEEQFRGYTANYNLEDPKIRLKFDHTFRVAELSEHIAKSLDLSAEEVDLAWVLGMFHDIGRFEQVRRYHTFRDAESVNHAALSADLLFKDGLVKDYLDPDEPEQDLMEKAVRLHNVYRLPGNLTERELMFCSILRDADKIDILRVNCETPREEIYDLSPEDFSNSEITEEVYQNMIHCEEVDRRFSKTGVDFIMGHIGFVYGLIYRESRQIVREQEYLEQLLNFESKNPETRERIAEICEIVNQYLEN